MRLLVLLLWVSAAKAQVQQFKDSFSDPVRLQGDTTFYVDPTGANDSQHGQAAGSGAFRTISYAVRWVGACVDAGGYAIVVQVAPGLYTDEVLLPDVANIKPGGWPARPLVLRGNPDNPFYGPVISVNGYAAVLAIRTNTAWEVEGFQIQSTVCDVEADAGSWIYVANNLHGMNGNPLATPQKLTAIYGGVIEMLGDEWFLSGGDQIVYVKSPGQFIQLPSTPTHPVRMMVYSAAHFQQWQVTDDSKNVVGVGVVFF